MVSRELFLEKVLDTVMLSPHPLTGKIKRHPGHICEKCCYLGANKILHETAKTTVVSLSGMIRFAEMAIFFGVQQLFFIRKAITSSTSNR